MQTRIKRVWGEISLESWQFVGEGSICCIYSGLLPRLFLCSKSLSDRTIQLFVKQFYSSFRADSKRGILLCYSVATTVFDQYAHSHTYTICGCSSFSDVFTDECSFCGDWLPDWWIGWRWLWLHGRCWHCRPPIDFFYWRLHEEGKSDSCSTNFHSFHSSLHCIFNWNHRIIIFWSVLFLISVGNSFFLWAVFHRTGISSSDYSDYPFSCRLFVSKSFTVGSLFD